MSYQYVYEMVGLSIIINGKRILEETNLSFLPKAKFGIIGPNGEGKPPLLKIMASIHKEFEGKATAEIGIKVGYLPQEPYVDASKNVLDNIVEGLHNKKNLLMNTNI